LSPTWRRRAVAHVRRLLAVSERRACRVLSQPRMTQRYEATHPDDEERLVARMRELAAKHPRYGYRRIWALLRRGGWSINRKRVHRLWRREGLKVSRPQKRKRSRGSSENSCSVRKAEFPNHVWTWDFIHDHTMCRGLLKLLSLVDEYTRECLALEVSSSITARDAIEVLRRQFLARGAPDCIRSDNGPEFIAKAIQGWLGSASVETLYVAPGSPWENGYAEAFHSRLRDELPEHGGIREREGSPGACEHVARRLQPGATAQFLGIPHAGRVPGTLWAGRDHGGIRSDASEPRALRLSLWLVQKLGAGQ